MTPCEHDWVPDRDSMSRGITEYDAMPKNLAPILRALRAEQRNYPSRYRPPKKP